MRTIGLPVVFAGVFVAGLAGCTALPGGSLDPLVPGLGLRRGESSSPPQPRSEAPVPAGASVRGPSQPSAEGLSAGEVPGWRAWVGRYRDTRGEGEIALTLMRDGSAIGGTWRLRTGGSGAFGGTLGPDGRTLSFSMRGGDRECVATLAGTGEYAGDQFSGSYRGTDCHGEVGEGRLDLRRQ